MGGQSSKTHDMSKSPTWNPKNAWMIDVIIDPSQGDVEDSSNMLFQAVIEPDGTCLPVTPGCMIFNRRMYDLNSVTPDGHYDGKLDFKLEFGARCGRPGAPASGWSMPSLIFGGMGKSKLGKVE